MKVPLLPRMAWNSSSNASKVVWCRYNVPLIPKYAEAERDIEERQRKVEQYIRQRDLNIVRIVPFSQGSWKGLD